MDNVRMDEVRRRVERAKECLEGALTLIKEGRFSSAQSALVMASSLVEIAIEDWATERKRA